MSVTVTDRSVEWSATVRGLIETGLARAALDIQRGAMLRAPHKTGALWNSIRTEKSGEFTYKVSANTPYARRWEFNTGLTDKLGRQYGPASFATGGDHYMRDAAQTVIPRFVAGSYFGGVG